VAEYGTSEDLLPQSGEKLPNSGKDISYYIRWIKAAKEAAKDHWRDARAAWKEYLNIYPEFQSGSQLKREPPKRYPIFYSTIKTIQPAYYSRTPIPVAKREFDADDPIARTACKLAERQSEYLMHCSPFDEAMYATRDEFILSDKATVRVFFEADVNTKPEREYVEPVQLEDGSIAFYDDDGQLLQANVQQDENNLYYTEESSEYVGDTKIFLVPVAYDDVLHSPHARQWEDIEDIAFKVILSKPEFEKRFPGKAAFVSFKKRSLDGKLDDKSAQMGEDPDLWAEVWEIWCKATKSVYWVCETYPDGFLDEKPDPYELNDFFPCTPFCIGTKSNYNLYPRPIYVILKPTIDQLHQLYNKLFDLISAVRRRGLADASIQEVIDVINNAWDNEIIAVQNFSSIVKKGGLANLIQYLPVKELSDAIAELEELTDRFKADFYEFSAVPDLMRSVSDPNETAEAQQMKGRFINLRFSAPLKQFQMLCKNAIALMLDLSLKKMDDQMLMETMGYKYLDPEDQMRFPQSLALLRDDDERHVRIDIETDSTSYMRDEINQQNRNVVIEAVITGLNTISGLATATPQYVPVALKALMFSLRGYNLGKDFEDEVEMSVKQLMEQQGQQQQSPDYEGVKLQLEQQKLEMQAQENQLKAQSNSINAELKGIQLATETEIKRQELALTAGKQAHQAEMDGVKLHLESRLQQLTELIQMQTLSIEEYKAKVHGFEKIAEEQRLAMEVANDIANPPVAREAQAPQQLHISVEAAPKKKRIIPIRNIAGDIVGADVEEMPTL
jgi:hypothetical protein